MRGGLRHAAIRLMSSAPSPSSRIGSTDVPCIVQMQQMLRGKTDVLSLAQGIVHWPPPAAALDAARDAVGLPQTNAYCADDGLPELRDALKARLAAEKGLVASEVMVTAGANQGYTNLVLSLLDAGDAAVLFRPYYFNHLMALQMTGSEIVTPASTPDLQPDLAALEAEIAARAADGRRPIRMLTLVNPGNPTGVMIPQATVEAASALCAAHGIWLVMDNTYEHFAYDGRPPHACVEGDHVINVFSFSKAFGMMGWRVGYLAFPPALVGELFKAQDTIVICPTVVSQRAALGALEAGGGSAWVAEKVAALAEQKALVLDALAPLGDAAVGGGSGAIYSSASCPTRTPTTSPSCAGSPRRTASADPGLRVRHARPRPRLLRQPRARPHARRRREAATRRRAARRRHGAAGLRSGVESVKHSETTNVTARRAAAYSPTYLNLLPRNARAGHARTRSRLGLRVSGFGVSRI